jgi:hypothetical protein
VNYEFSADVSEPPQSRCDEGEEYGDAETRGIDDAEARAETRAMAGEGRRVEERRCVLG